MKRYTTARGIIEHNFKFLLGQLGDGRWGFPGGGVEEGETPEQAVVREIREETGIHAIVNKQLAVIEGLNDSKQYWFYCTHVRGPQRMRAGDDFIKVEYVTRPDIYNLFRRGSLKFIPREVLDYIGITAASGR